MLGFFRKHAAIVTASFALVLSACNTFTDLQPMPDIYAHAETTADKALVTLKAFGAAQDTIETTCAPAVPDTDLASVCIPLIKAEQTLRPGVKAAGLIAAEYVDIDARIREAGPEAPAEWLALAAATAARLTAAYDPIKAEIDDFLTKAGDLTNG